MSTTYTQLLVEEGPIGAGPLQTLFIVPAGQLWVARDVCFYNEAKPATLLPGVCMCVANFDDVPFAGVGAIEARYGKVYRYELRQAFNPGDEARVTTTETGWTIRITGYIFNTS